VRFAVAPDINEDADGRPATVDLYVMFLRDRHAFDDADFHALWKDPRARLGDDLVGDSELVVAYPGSEPYRDYDNGNGARYVGIVGIFRAWESLNWRRLIPFPPLAGGCPENGTGRARNVTVHVTKRGLSVSLEAAVPGAVAP
jgi:type VI secretion system VasD/TssJ family lipoprotein